MSKQMYAGDLNTDHIGKVIEVTVSDGCRIRDELRSIVYGDLMEPNEGARRIWIEFKNVMPKNSERFAQFAYGFELDSLDMAQVL